MNAERLLQLYERVSEAPDAISRLRRFVLDLAVRGKLVEQDPEDEAAPLLLKAIYREKKQLIADGAIRNPRSLADEHGATGPFQLPPTWLWTRLDTVGAIIGGGTPPAGDSTNFIEPGGGIPWLTPADLGGYEKEYISRGSRDLTEKGLASSSATLMPTGSVLFTSRAPIGYVAIASNPLATNQGFKSIVPYVGECSRYIAVAMRAFAPEIDASAPGTTFKEVSGKIVAGIPFPLPPLAEQRRIVAKVDELMALCDRLEAERENREATRDRFTTSSLSRLNAPDVDERQFKAHADFAIRVLPELTTRPDQIKALRQTILDLAVRGKLVEQSPIVGPNATLPDEISREQKRGKIDRVLYGDGGLGSPTGTLDESLPNGWRWTTLGLVAESLRYGTSVKCGYRREGVPVLRIPNVSGGTVDLDDLKFGPLSSTQVRDLTLEYEDILLIRSNGSLEIVGRAAVVPREAAGMAFAGYLVRLRPDRSLALGPYLWLVLNSSDVRTQVEKPIRTTVGLKNINLKEFSALTFRLPPLSEQRRIVAMVDQMMIFCNRFSERLGVRSAIMTSLLEGLLTRALAPN